MHALQIASLGAVPHHHRTTARAHTVLRFVSTRFVTKRIPKVRGIHQKLSNTDHDAPNVEIFDTLSENRTCVFKLKLLLYGGEIDSLFQISFLRFERSPCMHGSGYIARRPVRTTGAPVPLLQRSLASKSPPQGVTIPNANSKRFPYFLNKNVI